jgi:hypothetical protein
MADGNLALLRMPPAHISSLDFQRLRVFYFRLQQRRFRFIGCSCIGYGVERSRQVSLDIFEVLDANR